MSDESDERRDEPTSSDHRRDDPPDPSALAPGTRGPPDRRRPTTTTTTRRSTSAPDRGRGEKLKRERQTMLLRRLLVATVVAATWTASGSSVAASGTPSVHVLYYAANNWVDAVVNGAQPCQGVRRCEWTQSPHVHQLKEKFHREVLPDATTISVAVFHVHSLRDKLNSRYPLNCDWRTNLTLGCSEESGVRYGHLFNATFPNFDGFSSYHPRSSVQRIQHAAYFKEGELRPTLHNFSSLIKAGSYVAKDCHTKGGDRANANRDQVVLSIRQAGFRIDGLSKCMRSQTPEGVYLPKTHDTVQNLLLKREAIARFMFNMAFENSIEEGYVTEKPFDALIAGTVPVYLGDASHLKRLLPHPKAAIFIADYKGNMQALADYLNYLTRNETAYEEHRAWRKNFTYAENVRTKPLLQKSWECQVCEWAVSTAAMRQAGAASGNGSGNGSVSVSESGNGSAAARGSGGRADHCVLQEKLKRPCAHLHAFAGKPLKSAATGDLFLVENGTIRAIPNADTFSALKLDHNELIMASAEDVARCARGPPLPPCTNC